VAAKLKALKRDVEEIWVWMIRSGNRPAKIAKELGVGRALVTCTIHGRKNNRRVLGYLLEKGCPPEILDLPEDMRMRRSPPGRAAIRGRREKWPGWSLG